MDPNSLRGEEKPPTTILAASRTQQDTDSAADGFQHPFARDAKWEFHLQCNLHA